MTRCADQGWTRRGALKGSAACAAVLVSGCGRVEKAREAEAPERGPAPAPETRAVATDPAWDATDTAERIASGEVSTRDVVEAAIERAKALDPDLNAIVTPTYERALDIAGDRPPGVFSGVPTFNKDLETTPGVTTKRGSRAYADFVPGPELETPFLKAFSTTGLVSLGKSSTPEFGATATTEPLLHGPTRNPWNTNHSVGGSSGGSAALVAAGVVPIATASDGGGSIRIPASCCGLFGLKTSRGFFKVAYPGEAPPIELSVPGCLSWSVRDSARFAKAVQDTSDGAPFAPIGDVTGPTERRLRVGFFTNSIESITVDPDVQDAVRSAATLLADMGHDVEEVDQPWDLALVDDFLLYWAAGAAEDVRLAAARLGRQPTAEDLEPWTLGLAGHFQENREGFEAAVGRLKRIDAEYPQLFADYDLMMCPVLAAPPPEIGYLAPDLPFETHLKRVTEYAPFTGVLNVTGAPAMSLPLGMSTDGLPIGVQVFGPVGADRLLLEVAYGVEDAAPWTGRRPSVSAF